MSIDLPAGFEQWSSHWQSLYLQLRVHVPDDAPLRTNLLQIATWAHWMELPLRTISDKFNAFCDATGYVKYNGNRYIEISSPRHDSSPRIRAESASNVTDNKALIGNNRREIAAKSPRTSLPPLAPPSLPPHTPLSHPPYNPPISPTRLAAQTEAADVDDSLIPDAEQYALTAVDAIAPAFTPEALVDLWNGMVFGKLPTVKLPLSPARSAALKTAIAAVPRRADWKQIITALLASEWHCGANSRKWRANLTEYLCTGHGAKAQQILEYSEAGIPLPTGFENGKPRGSDHPLSTKNIDRAARGDVPYDWRQDRHLMDPETVAAMEEDERRNEVGNAAN